jgi:palmitoyltransferase
LLNQNHEKLNPKDGIVIGVLFLITLPIICAVGMLAVWQIHLLMRNKTTIEDWDFEDLKQEAKKEGKSIVFPYDIGIVENVKQIMGRNPLLWLLPTKPEGDGLSFRLSKTYQGTP